MKRDLTHLIAASRALQQRAQAQGSLEGYFSDLHNRLGRDPKAMAMALGSSKSLNKLPGLGIPLAAEFLKNIGFDVAKPDRHVNRAVGSFDWVEFSKWPDRSGTTPPTATDAELLAVMVSVEQVARCTEQPVTLIDNAIWLLCAKSGLYYSNASLKSLIES